MRRYIKETEKAEEPAPLRPRNNQVGRRRFTVSNPVLTGPIGIRFQRLKLWYDELLSNFVFKFDLRRYNQGVPIRNVPTTAFGAPPPKKFQPKDEEPGRAGPCRICSKHAQCVCERVCAYSKTVQADQPNHLDRLQNSNLRRKL